MRNFCSPLYHKFIWWMRVPFLLHKPLEDAVDALMHPPQNRVLCIRVLSKVPHPEYQKNI